VVALGGEAGAQATFISVYSIANGLGRLASGRVPRARTPAGTLCLWLKNDPVHKSEGLQPDASKLRLSWRVLLDVSWWAAPLWADKLGSHILASPAPHLGAGSCQTGCCACTTCHAR